MGHRGSPPAMATSARTIRASAISSSRVPGWCVKTAKLASWPWETRCDAPRFCYIIDSILGRFFGGYSLLRLKVAQAFISSVAANSSGSMCPLSGRASQVTTPLRRLYMGEENSLASTACYHQLAFRSQTAALHGIRTRRLVDCTTISTTVKKILTSIYLTSTVNLDTIREVLGVYAAFALHLLST